MLKQERLRHNVEHVFIFMLEYMHMNFLYCISTISANDTQTKP